MLDESDRLRRNRRLEANPILPVDANLDVARRIDTAVNFALGARLEDHVEDVIRDGLMARRRTIGAGSRIVALI